MTNKAEKLLYSFLYLFALYLAIRLLPLRKWFGSYTWAFLLVQFILLSVLVVLTVYESKRSLLKPVRNENHPNFLLLLPLLIGCSSNILYCLCFQIKAESTFTYLFFLETLNTLAGVVVEELLFRYFFFAFLGELFQGKKNEKLFVIFFSSLAFGLMHCINFFGNNPLSVLMQIGYTFLLGILLGSLSYLYETPLIPILGHFFFNFLNTDVFNHLYSVDVNVSYVLFSIGIGLLVLGYLGLLYYLYRRKCHATK